jgi:putative glutathione S-transferase
MKGLEHVISYSIVHPTWARTKPNDPEDEHCGWHFRKPGDPPVPNPLGYGANVCDDALIPDTVNRCATLRGVYEKADDQSGKYSTPVLWDKKHGTIVCNESKTILRILNSAFGGLAKHPHLNFFPEDKAAEMQELDDFIYPTINNGVYRCGFAKSQQAYETAFDELFASLDRVENILSSKRYLTGDKPTAMDLRLFMTLIRFDAVYFVYFKTNKKKIREYPNLFEYCKDMYQLPEMARAINMDHIKMHYFTSHPSLNMYGIIPKGPDVDYLQPHNRA